MAGSTPRAPGRIFISYRREDTAYPAGWLYDRLSRHFGRKQVFKDVDSIEFGDDFPRVIADAVGSCDVLLVLIGSRWLTITDQAGTRRLDLPDDFVRLEVEAGLERNVRVIPILVDGATLPRADQLPPSLAPMVRRHALQLSPSQFDFDTSRLLRVLDETLADAHRPTEAAGWPAVPRTRGKAAPVAAALLVVVMAVVAALMVLPTPDGDAGSDDQTPTSAASSATTTVTTTRTTRQPTTTASSPSLFRGFVLRRPSLAYHAGPRLSAQVIGYLPYNQAVYVVCTAVGDAVTGPGRAGGPPITTRVWDKVRSERDGEDLGFVPDAFVKTGTTEPVAGPC